MFFIRVNHIVRREFQLFIALKMGKGGDQLFEVEPIEADFSASVVLSEYAKNRYFEATEKAEKAAQDMASVAMQTIVFSMNVNDDIEDGELNDIDDDVLNAELNPDNEYSSISLSTMKTKETEYVHMSGAMMKKAEEAAKKRAKEAAREMATTTLSTVMQAMKSEENSNCEAMTAIKEKLDDKWYLFWNEEHRREYYYQPCSNSSLWQKPGTNEYTIKVDDVVEPARNKPSSLQKEEVTHEKKMIQYNLNYTEMDEFLSIHRHENSPYKKKNKKKRRKKKPKKNHVQRNKTWIIIPISICSVICSKLIQLYVKEDVATGSILTNMNSHKEAKVKAVRKTKRSEQIIENVENERRQKATKSKKEEKKERRIDVDANTLGYHKIPQRERTHGSNNQQRFENQEEIGIHSSMTDLAKEVHIEANVMESLMEFFSSGLKDASVDASQISARVNGTSTQQGKNAVKHDLPEWCGIPLLKQLAPECNRNRRRDVKQLSHVDQIMDTFI